MKKVFYLTTFLSLCCFYVGKSNTLLLKKVNNVTNPHLNLLNKIRNNSKIGQNILKGEKYKIEHELKNSEGFDHIPQRFLVDGISYFSKPLCGLFSLIYKTKQIPEQWLISEIIPIFKKAI